MKHLSLILLFLVLFAFPSSVLADVAPPINPPGSNPEPGTELTQVRMVTETVLIDVQNDFSPHSLGRARVAADFTMRNLGTADESMAVRFPITTNDGRGEYPEITDLVVKLNGKQIQYRRASYPDFRYRDQDIPWAEFDVTFPAGQDVALQVAYNINGSGYPPFTAFYYILETGAGWKDTIGSADVILRLPYPASSQNVILNLQIGWAETTPGGVFQGNEARWHFENFEPGPYDIVQNMEFALVSPVAWQTVLKAREATAKNPNDGEAWGTLAKAYKDIFFLSRGYRTDAGGEELYRLSIEAYEKCLVLKPDDAEWHAGFADLLAGRSYWDSWMGVPTSETYRALEEIHIALRLAPNDAKVKEIAQKISYMIPEGMTQKGTGYDFPWLTETPTPPPPTATIVPVYDPAVISGTYQSDKLTLANDKQASLTLTLRPDHSAELESRDEANQVVVSTGTWMDYGDGSVSITVVDPNNRQMNMRVTIENEVLNAIEYPGFYGEAGIQMKRLATATPAPASMDTPQPAPSGTAPTSKPSLPICGSAALAPLGIVFWWARKRKQ